MSRYHKAAIDGYLDLLKEATRKDLNTPDEDGMTPTLWAAFHGQADALQLICSRGGDPNRSDIWGNTPLHHASTNGHMHILSFLVNFGANLFALDNELHTAMDVAAARDRMDCVRFLDAAASQQTSQNARKVARLKQDAAKEAERRVKLCEKVKKRHQSKMERMYRGGSGAGSVSEASTGSSFSNSGTINGVNEQFSKLIASDTGSLSARVKGTLQRKFGKKERGGTLERSDGNVIFVRQENGAAEKPDFTDVFSEQDENELAGGPEDGEDGGDWSSQATESIFNRPGLGNMVFRKNLSMEMGLEPEDFPSRDAEDAGTLFLGTVVEADAGFGEDGEDDDDAELPWNQEEIGLDDQTDEETSPLDAFLSAIALPDFAPALEREQLDLEALMLCSDDDLKGIRIQLGPRKKILEAAARRRNALQTPSAMKDSYL